MDLATVPAKNRRDVQGHSDEWRAKKKARASPNFNNSISLKRPGQNSRPIVWKLSREWSGVIRQRDENDGSGLLRVIEKSF